MGNGVTQSSAPDSPPRGRHAVPDDGQDVPQPVINAPRPGFLAPDAPPAGPWSTAPTGGAFAPTGDLSRLRRPVPPAAEDEPDEAYYPRRRPRQRVWIALVAAAGCTAVTAAASQGWPTAVFNARPPEGARPPAVTVPAAPDRATSDHAARSGRPALPAAPLGAARPPTPSADAATAIVDITNRSTDPRPLTVAELFPTRTVASYGVVRTDLVTGCRPAATGGVVGDLAAAYCTQVVRAALKAPRLRLTVGVANLATDAAAQRLADSLAGSGTKGTLVPLEPEKRSAAADHMVVSTRGHYLIYVLGSVTGGGAQRAAASARLTVAMQQLRLYANDTIARRAFTPTSVPPPPAPARRATPDPRTLDEGPHRAVPGKVLPGKQKDGGKPAKDGDKNGRKGS